MQGIVLNRYRIEGPAGAQAGECERILRSLPEWFGIESALVDYVRDATIHPTFTVCHEGRTIGFVTLRQHFAASWEVHCIAVERQHHGRGAGLALHRHAERWLHARGARVLQVKTLSADDPSAAYARTRPFYERLGYAPLEVFTHLWGSDAAGVAVGDVLPQPGDPG
jgi:GNAT superfamily N-acetyltransferase